MSRNYKEDQASEVEALSCIYYGELEIITTEPYHKFEIPIATEDYNPEDESSGIACKLVFSYTAQYPDAEPEFEIEEAVNFDDGFKSGMRDHLQKSIRDNLGMEMIFSLVCSAQEWLNERWDEHKVKLENERERKLIAAEEEERKKFEGTRVNVETFTKWRIHFEDSMGIAARREKCADSKKLTGKELFLRDNTLNDSDIKYLMEAGDSIGNVKIDQSLFQNFGDLEFESDDDEDEDWQ